MSQTLEFTDRVRVAMRGNRVTLAFKSYDASSTPAVDSNVTWQMSVSDATELHELLSKVLGFK